MGRARRIGLGEAAVVAVIALTLPGSAAGAVTFGNDLGQAPSFGLLSGVTVVQRELDSGDAAAGGTTAPSDGVITSWSIRKLAGSEPGVLALRVVHGNTSVYRGPLAGFPATGGVHSVDARVKVKTGDAIGVDYLAGSPAIVASGGRGDVWQLPALGATETRAPTAVDLNYRLSLNADLEPDCDNDGFGDETQDQSIESCNPPDTQAPSVEITKGAPNKLRKSKVKFKFTSDDPTATFECKADRKPYKPCSSPKKLNRLDEGKHKFKVRATDPAGNVGAPVRDRFRVV